MLNVTEVMLGTNQRKSFGKIEEVMSMPNLIQVQKDSYRWFIDTGLKEVLRDMSEITDYSGNLVLSFVDYSLDESRPKYSVKECKERDTTYAAPMRLVARLYNKQTGTALESEVYVTSWIQTTMVIHGFRLYGGSALVTPILFKGQF